MKKNKPIIFSLTAIFLFGACGPKGADTWGNCKPLNEIDKYIQGYYDASLGEAVNPKKGHPVVYVDFSDGLIQAYSGNPTNGQIIQAITNKLLSPEIEWNALGGSQINKLEYNSNELFNKVNDASQYKEIMAPIQDALKQITTSNNDALLITDFEEYTSDKTEQFENYPKTYFTEWLKKGNSITFFYANAYTEKNKKSGITTQKHLYFTVFTYGKPTETSMVSQIKDAFKGRIVTTEFDLNNNPYAVSNDYGGKDNTGIANQTFSKWANLNINASADKKLPYEVIGINKPWDKDLERYIQNIINKEQGLFMTKLYLNALDQSSYKLNKVAVKVYDISDDYVQYARCDEAKKHIPILTKDAKKDLVWNASTKKDPIIKECYETNKTDIKKDWIYKPADLSSNEQPEIFDFDKEIFSGHLKNDPGKIELRTVFHPNYKLKNIKSKNAFLRIDYVIEDVSFNDSNPQLADFQWSSITQKSKPNTSLSEAIRNTLQDPSINPKGKIIYSYYIKFYNTK